MRKLPIAACIASLGIIALVPMSASAARSATHVTVKIKVAGNGFKGRVTSPRESCVTDRKVTLQRRKAGQDSYTGVGSDRASKDGTWSVDTAVVNRARYRAVIKEKVGARGCFGITTEPTRAYATSVTIAEGPSNLHGKVSSHCERDREVALQRQAPGASAFHTIGSDLTDKNGRWVVNKAPRHGSAYRARANAKQPDSTTSCMRGTSGAVHG